MSLNKKQEKKWSENTKQALELDSDMPQTLESSLRQFKITMITMLRALM